MSEAKPSQGRAGLDYSNRDLRMIVAVSILSLMMFLNRFTFSVYVVPLSDALGVSRLATSSVFSLYMIMYALFSALYGFLWVRIGTRRLLLVSVLFSGSGLILLKWAPGLTAVLVGFGLLHGIGAGGLYALPVATAKQWFGLRSGIPMGIIHGVNGLGVTIGPIFAQWLLNRMVWRSAFFLSGLVSLALMLGCLAVIWNLIGRKTPVERPRGAVRPLDILWSLPFVFLSLGYGMYGFAQYTTMIHFPGYAIEEGTSPMVAATILSLIGLFGLPARIILGWLTDRFGTNVIIAGVAWLTFTPLVFVLGVTPLTLVLFMILFSFGHGGMIGQFPAILSEAFGQSNLPLILGLESMFIALFGSLGALWGGYLYGATGSYALAFPTNSVVFVLVTISLILGKWAYSRPLHQ